MELGEEVDANVDVDDKGCVTPAELTAPAAVVVIVVVVVVTHTDSVWNREAKLRLLC